MSRHQLGDKRLLLWHSIYIGKTFNCFDRLAQQFKMCKSRKQTLTRKTKESLMAILLELSYDKKFILERYMNTVYLAQQGSTAFHGFASGSLYYFNKDVSSLNLKEMAHRGNFEVNPSSS